MTDPSAQQRRGKREIAASPVRKALQKLKLIASDAQEVGLQGLPKLLLSDSQQGLRP